MQFKIFCNPLTATRTVSNTYAQVARARPSVQITWATINWATTRNWRTKVLNTLKVTLLNLLRQKSVSKQASKQPLWQTHIHGPIPTLCPCDRSASAGVHRQHLCGGGGPGSPHNQRAARRALRPRTDHLRRRAVRLL